MRHSLLLSVSLILATAAPQTAAGQMICNPDGIPPKVTLGIPVATFELQDGWVANLNTVTEACGLTWEDECGGIAVHGINQLVSLSGEEIGGVPGAWRSRGIRADWHTFQLNLDRNEMGPRRYRVTYAVIDEAWNWTFVDCVVDVVDRDAGATRDLCNGIDDDDDGLVDEDFVPEVTRCGQGACIANGQTACEGGSVVDLCQPGVPTPELCGTGVDENCDGEMDDDFDVGAPCAAGVGVCRQEGVRTCTADGLDTICGATPRVPGAERCDNAADDDCDGQTDEADCENQVDCNKDVVPPTVKVERPAPVITLQDGPGWIRVPVRALCQMSWQDDCTGEDYAIHGINELTSPTGEVIFGKPGAYRNAGVFAEWHEIQFNLNRNEVQSIPRRFCYRFGRINPKLLV